MPVIPKFCPHTVSSVPGFHRTSASELEVQFHSTTNFHVAAGSNGEGNGTPLQYCCLENPMDGGVWWATVQGVGHDWVTSLSLSLSCIGEGNVNPLQSSCLENPRDRRAWWPAVYGVTQSWTWLTWLSRAEQSRAGSKSVTSNFFPIFFTEAKHTT